MSLASLEKYEGALTLIIVGAAYLILSYIYPRDLQGTRFTPSGKQLRFLKRISGIILIIVGIILWILG